MIRAAFILSLAALALSACGDKTAADKTGNDKRHAEGEVLGGTISDAMIPLDTLTSQSPPMKIVPKTAASASGEPAAKTETAEAAPEAEAAPAVQSAEEPAAPEKAAGQ